LARSRPRSRRLSSRRALRAARQVLEFLSASFSRTIAPLDPLISIPKHKSTNDRPKNVGGCPKKSNSDRPSSKNCSLNRDVEWPSVGTIFCSYLYRPVSHGASLCICREEGPGPHRPARRQPGADAPYFACNEPGKELGAALGLSFQQVQKYERGTNRIGASRLQQISHILQVPVAFFFEGAPNASA